MAQELSSYQIIAKLAKMFNFTPGDVNNAWIIDKINQKLPRGYEVKAIVTHNARYSPKDLLKLSTSGDVIRGESVVKIDFDEQGPLVMISSPTPISFAVQPNEIGVVVAPKTTQSGYYFVQDSPTVVRLMHKEQTIMTLDCDTLSKIFELIPRS